MPRERTWHSFWHSVELPWDFSYCQVTQTVLGSDPLSAFQEHLQWWCCCLQHSDPDRITMSENSAFKRFIQVCARIQHLQGLPLCLAIRTYSRWKEKKKKKTKCFCRAHQCRKLKPYIGDPYIARSIPYELRLKGCKLLCFISWGHKDNRGGSTHVPQRV